MKVLLIRLSSAGDILLMSGAVKILKKAGIETHLLVKPQFRPVAELLGADRIFYYENTSSLGQFRGLEYGLTADLHGTLRSVLIRNAIKSERVTVIKKGTLRRRLLVLFKWFRGSGIPVHDNYIKTVSDALKIRPENIKKLSGKNKTGPGNRQVLMHAGARWGLKRWPYMAKLAELLAKNGYKVYITGVKDEVENTDRLLYIKGKGINNLIGKTDLKQLFALIKKCGAFVGNDTMAAHAAVFFGKPALVFMGPTVSEFGFIDGRKFTVMEKDLACRPCGLHGKGRCATGTFECMKKISPEEALSAFKKQVFRK